MHSRKSLGGRETGRSLPADGPAREAATSSCAACEVSGGLRTQKSSLAGRATPVSQPRATVRDRTRRLLSEGFAEAGARSLPSSPARCMPPYSPACCDKKIRAGRQWASISVLRLARAKPPHASSLRRVCHRALSQPAPRPAGLEGHRTRLCFRRRLPRNAALLSCRRVPSPQRLISTTPHKCVPQDRADVAAARCGGPRPGLRSRSAIRRSIGSSKCVRDQRRRLG